MSRRRFVLVLAFLLAVGALVRVGYVAVQPSVDPSWDRPILDAEYYVDWARSIAGEEDVPPGAFYRAPLYPYLLAVFVGIFGTRFALLYLFQQARIVATAGLLAWGGRRVVGEAGALIAAGLFLGYHPALFFASAPFGEATALVLLAVALEAESRETPAGSAVAGLTVGLASLARPNLLLVPGAWGAFLAFRRRWKPIVFLAAGAILVLTPILLRNLAASGHLVPVSANSGLTFYHGNGPQAEGVYTPAEGFSGMVASQQREATFLASSRAGHEMDPVEADRWWGRQGVRTRLGDPTGTAKLVVLRLLLTLGNREISVDYAPRVDANPFRWGAPVPFAALAGLAAAGVFLLGLKKTGGRPLWGALLATGLTPVLFYFSSRYRLPLAMLLCLPAGAGLSALVGAVPGTGGRRRLAAGLLALGVAALSMLAPGAGLAVGADAGALANRGSAWSAAGFLDRAEGDLRAALAMDAGSVTAIYNLGVVREGRRDVEGAEDMYRRVLNADPYHAEAAGNLAAILVRRGAAGEAVEILRRAIRMRPDHVVCRVNLIVALQVAGDPEGARQAALDGLAAGVPLDEGLLRSVGLGDPERRDER